MILIYAIEITPRINYITKFLFTELLGVEVLLTSNREEFKTSELPKVNYSGENLGGIPIRPVNLLFEKNTTQFECEIATFEDFTVLFPTSQEEEIRFDPFAASFFMLSRYEEYWDQPLDKHGRVMAEESVAYKHNFLDSPVVDQWAYWLKKKIEMAYPRFRFPQRQYKYIPTMDVDVAYAYRYRNPIRTVGATLKSIIRGDFSDNRLRFRTFLGNMTDPFDTYGFACELFEQFGFEPVFFFLIGKYGRFDKNISPHHRKLRSLIELLHSKYDVGIHPSYGSNSNYARLISEIRTLEKITKSPVNQSRQHFLKMKLPDTYQQLLSGGITKDYTMGYASQLGFRAGTCTPFHFYDLVSEKETSLMIYPFQVMDGTLNQYLKLSPEESITRVVPIIEQVKKVNGTFLSLWHNESLSETREWKNWREVYTRISMAAL